MEDKKKWDISAKDAVTVGEYVFPVTTAANRKNMTMELRATRERLEEVTIERDAIRVDLCEKSKENKYFMDKNIGLLIQLGIANDKIEALMERELVDCDACEYHPLGG